MRLDQSTKRLLIAFGVLLLVYGGIQVYNYIQRSKEEERYALMMEQIYEANPGLKEEHAEYEERLRLYGPRALDTNFRPDGEEVAGNNVIRKSVKLEDGSDQITVFYEEGKPREEFVMKDGKLDGIFKLWDTNGRLIEESEYENNLLNGVQKSFYSNGNVKMEVSYVNGQKSGPTKSWYKNGNQSSETEFLDNKIIGSTSFYQDGSIRMKETMEPSGLMLTEAFYENGQLSHSFGSIGGKKEGIFVKNAPTGFKVAEASYKNGKNDGWCRVWNEKGDLDIELLYKDGQLDRSANMIGNTCDINIWQFGFR